MYRRFSGGQSAVFCIQNVTYGSMIVDAFHFTPSGDSWSCRIGCFIKVVVIEMDVIVFEVSGIINCSSGFFTSNNPRTPLYFWRKQTRKIEVMHNSRRGVPIRSCPQTNVHEGIIHIYNMWWKSVKKLFCNILPDSTSKAPFPIARAPYAMCFTRGTPRGPKRAARLRAISRRTMNQCCTKCLHPVRSSMNSFKKLMRVSIPTTSPPVPPPSTTRCRSPSAVNSTYALLTGMCS